MRLEGSPRIKWMKELETSRQNFRILAESEKSTNLKTNLEAAVMLARMDLNKLKTIPLPNKDSGKGSSGCWQGRGDRPGQGEGNGEGEGKGKPNDARGAGLGQRPEGTGS